MPGRRRAVWLIKTLVMAALLIDCAAAGPQRPATTAPPLVVTEAQIAPDGAAIAFIRGRLPQAPATIGPANLWRVSFAGGEPERLTADATSDSHPRWSPDGRQIAFLSRSLADRAPSRVLIAPAIGGVTRTVTDEQTDVLSFEWSPDGRRIAYLGVRSDGDRPKRLQIVDVASGDVLQPASINGDVSSFAWSPAGSALAALVEDTGRPSVRVAVFPVAGPAREIASAATSRRDVGWSPDGATIAWIEGDTAAGSAGEDARVVVAPAVGGPSRALSLAGSGSPSRLSWSGDARLSIVFSTGRETWVDLLDVRTGMRVTVLPPGTAIVNAPASWSADGTRFVVVGSAPEHPAEAFAGQLPLAIPGGSDTAGAPPPPVRRITFSN